MGSSAGAHLAVLLPVNHILSNPTVHLLVDGWKVGTWKSLRFWYIGSCVGRSVLCLEYVRISLAMFCFCSEKFLNVFLVDLFEKLLKSFYLLIYFEKFKSKVNMTIQLSFSWPFAS